MFVLVYLLFLTVLIRAPVYEPGKKAMPLLPQRTPTPRAVVPWGSKDHLETALRVPGWELRPHSSAFPGNSPLPRDRRAVNRHSRLPHLLSDSRKSRKGNCFFFF